MSNIARSAADHAAPNESPGAAPQLRDMRDLPGPRGWPVLGNLPQIKPAQMHLQLGRWAHEYGRYYQLRMGSQRVLVVADHEAVAAVLRDRPEGFRRTQRMEDIGLEMGLKPGLFSSNGEAWKRQRRLSVNTNRLSGNIECTNRSIRPRLHVTKFDCEAHSMSLFRTMKFDHNSHRHLKH